MTQRLAVIAVSCAGLVLLAGCSRVYHIQIQSDTCWSGTVNDDQNISDCGSSNYKVEGKLTCVKIEKLSVDGYLRLRVDGGQWAETTESHGLIQVCQ